MDAKDFRRIQEAYREVYQELDEAERPLPYGRMMKKSNELADSGDKKKQKRAAKIYTAANAPKGPKVKVREEQVDIYDNNSIDEADDLESLQKDTQSSVDRMKKGNRITRAGAHIAAHKVARDVKKASAYGPQRPKAGQTGAYRINNEEYNYILSHLIDEGYTNTLNGAEVIASNMSDEWIVSILEATAMAKRGLDEPAIRQKIAASTGGGAAADRATALERKPTFGDAKKAKARQDLAKAQRGDFRKTTSSSPGLHGYAHKSNDPEVKAKQAARGAQRGALTPAEKKQFGR